MGMVGVGSGAGQGGSGVGHEGARGSWWWLGYFETGSLLELY